MRCRSLCGFAFAALLTLGVVAAGWPNPAAAAPMPVGYRDYDGWNAIRTPRLSDDGRFLAHALTPDYGDPTLVVRDLVSGVERREPRGSAPLFTADAAYVVYTILPPQLEIDAAKRAKKSDAEQPKNDLGILDLRDGSLMTFARVKSVRVARGDGRFIAFRYEPAATGAPASPAPKTDKAKAKEDGGDLAVFDL